MAHALVVEDDADSARMLASLLHTGGFTAATASSLRDARRQIALQRPDIVLLDLQLPDGNGLSLCEEAELLSYSEVVLITGHASLDTSIQALRLGAADYLIKPVDTQRLNAVLSRARSPSTLLAEIQDMRLQWESTGRFGHLLGRSPIMREVYEQIACVAGTSVSVFVTGESGSGKELVARTLHDLSRRRDGPFLAVNCGAISPQLIESEIFGHERGSFTGADRQHLGFFERANGGTLFLDEITEMPLELQVKLLRVLETGTFLRVGSTEARHTDVRIVAASNRNLAQAVVDGALREDLLYRLNVFPLHLPPLRDRLEDLPLLAQHFLDDIAAREGGRKTLTAAALERLAQYRWPGNVRELRNVLQRAFVMTQEGPVTERWLPRDLVPSQPPLPLPPLAPQQREMAPMADGAAASTELRLPLGSSLAEVERALILATFAHCGQRREQTAAMLGISMKTLYNRLKEYGDGA